MRDWMKQRRALWGILALGMITGLVPKAPAIAQEDVWAHNGYVFFQGDSKSAVMAGTLDDYRAAQRLRKGQEEMLYVRRGNAAYVLRDAATLDRAKTIIAPMQALGARQAALGAQQAELGGRQAQLGARQAKLGRQRAGRAGDAQLGREKAALGADQAALGKQQRALGTQQASLGRQQRQLAHEVEQKLGVLVDDAVRRGLATAAR